jgi:hypothetical protein
MVGFGTNGGDTSGTACCCHSVLDVLSYKFNFTVCIKMLAKFSMLHFRPCNGLVLRSGNPAKPVSIQCFRNNSELKRLKALISRYLKKKQCFIHNF